MLPPRDILIAGFLTLPVAAAAADLSQLLPGGVPRVIVAADEAPETFSIAPSPDPGFERELLEGFARLHRLRLEVVSAPGYPERITMLQRGEGDVVAAIFDTPDRRKLVDFTAEVMPTWTVAVTAGARAPVRSVDELQSMEVGVIKGAKPAQQAVEAGVPAAALRHFDRRDDLLAALRDGAVGAAILPVSELAVAGSRFGRLSAGVTIGEPGKVAWAMRKGEADLARALDEYIANVRRGPTWSRLVVKYFGDQTLVVLGRNGR